MTRTGGYALEDERLLSLSEELLDHHLLNPVNTAEERERFLNSSTYEPRFTYAPYNPGPAMSELRALRFGEDAAGRLLARVRDFLLAYAEMLRRRGSGSFSSEAVYGRPGSELVARARALLRQPRPSLPGEVVVVTPEGVKRAMEEELAAYGLSWRVVISTEEGLAAVTVNSAARRLTIAGNRSYTRRHVEKLKAHEVATHVLRAENGASQPLKVFSSEAIPGYLAVEEGLAKWNEALVGAIDERLDWHLALRVVAARLAATASFRSVYEHLLALNQDEREAFRLTLRVKRGLGDASRPGGFFKDHLYLEGKLLIERFVKSGGRLADLYAGKIGLDELSLLGSLLSPPRLLPRFYHRRFYRRREQHPSPSRTSG